MRSTIRIELDFDTNTPVIEIKSDSRSDDLKDKILQHFYWSFGGDSSWAKIKFLNSEPNSGVHVMRIIPLTRSSFPDAAIEMLWQHQWNVENNNPGTVAYAKGDPRGKLMAEILPIVKKYRESVAPKE